MRPRLFLALAAGLLVAFTATGRSLADETAPYPEFVAEYDASVNGIGIGTVTVTLKHEGDGRYVYRQESESSGLVSLFTAADSRETSHWQLRDGRIAPLEYRSKRKGGDDDDNEHLLYDWEAHKVKNVGAGPHWEIDLPEGTLDRLVMQLAILFDLRDGAKQFDYRVPRQGKLKDYRFALVGEDDIELTSGVYRTLKVARTNDDNDKNLVWSAPELDYFPVRFLKHKKSGLKITLALSKLDFAPFGEESSALEVAP
jgi:hypothetical protein